MPRTDEQREKKRKERYESKIRNTNIILNIKKITPCSVCGQYCFTFYIDFHHFIGEKKDNISKLKRATKTTLLKEIRKCAIVCFPCHTLIHQDKIEPILKPIDTSQISYPGELKWITV